MWMTDVASAQSAVQGNDFELIPTVKLQMEHSVGWPLGRELSSIYIVRGVIRSDVASR